MRYGKRADRQAAGVKAAAWKKNTEQPSRPSAEQPVLCPRPCAMRIRAMREYKKNMYVCRCVRSHVDIDIEVDVEEDSRGPPNTVGFDISIQRCF